MQTLSYDRSWCYLRFAVPATLISWLWKYEIKYILFLFEHQETGRIIRQRIYPVFSKTSPSAGTWYQNDIVLQSTFDEDYANCNDNSRNKRSCNGLLYWHSVLLVRPWSINNCAVSQRSASSCSVCFAIIDFFFLLVF